MPGGSFRFAWPVLNLTHLVHVNERIQEPLIETVKRPADRKPLALRRQDEGVDSVDQLLQALRLHER